MTQVLQRTAIVLLASSALAACASATQPNFPIRAEPAPAPVPAPAPAPAAEDGDMPEARPVAPVESRPLDAPAPPTPVAPAPEAAPSAPPPAAPVYETVTRRTVTGRVVEVPGRPQTYRVKRGDNLARVARELGTTVGQLRDDNDLRGSTIHPGDDLRGPAPPAKAYVVGSGDTLFSIARRFGVTAEALRSENGLSRNASLRSGQRLRLPEGYRDRGPITATTRVLVSAGTAASGSEAEADDAGPPPGSAGQPSRAWLPPEPAVRTVTTRSVTGRVVSMEVPGQVHVVKRGDNLEKIARKLDTTVDALKDDNDLRRSTIQPGQRLRGPSVTVKAYVPVAGDTMAAIAQRFGVTSRSLAAVNGLSRNAAVRPGRRLRLPEGYRDRGPLTSTRRIVTEEAPPPAPLRPALPVSPPSYSGPAPRPYTPPPATAVSPYTPPAVAPRPYVPPPVQARPYVPSSVTPPATASLSDPQISQLGRGRFIWPMQGDIVSDYGPKGAGQRNDGVNLGAALGETVRAAASGDVVYAGDQVPGFGNLVLIKHADGWVTAYGHLARVDVRMQQKVSQGQQIGQAGATGGVTSPQLHFEVRYAPSPLERARPVDPKLVLPR